MVGMEAMVETSLCCVVNPITKCPACKIQTCQECHGTKWPPHPVFDVEYEDDDPREGKCTKRFHHQCPGTGLIVHKDSTKEDVQTRLQICEPYNKI